MFFTKKIACGAVLLDRTYGSSGESLLKILGRPVWPRGFLDKMYFRRDFTAVKLVIVRLCARFI